MRPGSSLNTATATTTATSSTNTKAPFSTETDMQQRSPWHSPVPYLFGGLAAMLGLIAFALLILACSYWKLAGRLDGNEGGDDQNQRDLETGNDDDKLTGESGKSQMVYEEKILVIMAGDRKPTFLATPISNYKASSFGDVNDKSENNDGEKVEKSEKDKHFEQSTTEAAMEEENQQEIEAHQNQEQNQ